MGMARVAFSYADLVLVLNVQQSERAILKSSTENDSGNASVA